MTIFNKYLLLCVILFACTSVHSQEVDSRSLIRHQFGIKGGINYSSVVFKPTVSQELKPGFLLGGVYNYQAQKAAGIQIEFLYAQYGWVETFGDPDAYYNRTLNYLEMPLLSNFVIGKKKTHLKLLLGTRFAYLLSDTEDTNITDDERVYYGLSIPDNFEIGIAFGGAISHLFPFGELQIDARFNATLSNLFDPTNDLELQNSKNQSIALSVYYWFDAK